MRSSRVGGSRRDPKGKNWMTAMGILFIVMALIIALRNFYFITTELSFAFYLDNYTNGQITNEKFVIAMIIGGGVLIFWGYFKKNQDDEKDTRDEDGWRSVNDDQRK
jgi:hypothetical protein